MKNVALALLCGLLCACAQTPPLTIGYYLPTTTASVKVTRTVSCTSDDLLVVASSATVTAVHAANPREERKIAIGDLDGDFTNIDIKFEFYEDRRLKGVNATGTGQGETILKSAIALAPLIFGFDRGTDRTPEQCKAIVAAAGKDKPLSLTFAGDIDVTRKDANQIIPPDLSSAFLFNGGKAPLKTAMGDVCVVVGTAVASEPAVLKVGAVDPANGKTYTMLHLRQPGLLPISLWEGASCKDGAAHAQSEKIFQGAIPVAQLGAAYDLPVPRALLFGKQTFVLAIAESGAVTAIQYAKEAGTANVLNVLNSAAAAAQGQTAAEQAAEVKAQADLIAQQERLVRCRATPAACS